MFHYLNKRNINPGSPSDLYLLAKGSPSLVQRLSLWRTMDVHSGCVNTVVWDDTGQFLLSGSDDRCLVISNPFLNKKVCSVVTSHRSNIFSAKFLPGCSNEKIVSCAGDGTIIYTDLERVSETQDCRFRCHSSSVYDVVTVPGDSHCFLTCGEDSTVRWFDLRDGTSCAKEKCRENVLLDMGCSVTALCVNPIKPYEMAVGTIDSKIRVYDRRMIRVDGWAEESWRAVMLRMRPSELKGRHQRITCLRYDELGSHILASYSSAHLYLFDTQSCQCERLSPDREKPTGGEEGEGGGFSSMMKRLRLRGDWSDTGPQARPERLANVGGALQNPAGTLGQARPTLQSALMQRMSSMLSRMLTSNPPPSSQPTPLRMPAPSSAAIPRVPSPPESARGNSAAVVSESAASSAASVSVAPTSVTSSSHGAEVSSSNPSECPLETSVPVDTSTVSEVPGCIEGTSELTSTVEHAPTPVTTSNPTSFSSHNSPSSDSPPLPKSDEGTTSSTSLHCVGSSNDSMTPVKSTDHCQSSSTDASSGSGECQLEQQGVVNDSEVAALALSQTNDSLEDSGAKTENVAGPFSNDQAGERTTQIDNGSEESKRASKVEEPTKTENLLGDASSTAKCTSHEPQHETPVCEGSFPGSPNSRNISFIQETFQDMRQEFINRHHVEPSVSLSYSKAGPSSGLITLQRPRNAPPLFTPDESHFPQSCSSSSQTTAPSGHDQAFTVTNTTESCTPSCNVSGIQSVVTADSEGSLSSEANPCDQSSPSTSCDQRSIVKEEMGNVSDSHCKASGSITLSLDSAGDTSASFPECKSENESPNENVMPSSVPECGSSREQDALTSEAAHPATSVVTEPMESAPSTSGCASQRPREASGPTRRSRSPDTEDSSDEEAVNRSPKLSASRRMARALQNHVKKMKEEAAMRVDGPPNTMVPHAKHTHTYVGHRNSRTMIKEACFWGRNHVMSGSDCGRIFVWERKTQKLVMLLEADHRVVNCLQPHPTLPLLASSGIDYNVKLWMPLLETPTFDEERAADIMQCNEMLLEETRDTITVPAAFMIRVLTSLNQMRGAQREERPAREPHSEDDDDDTDDEL